MMGDIVFAVYKELVKIWMGDTGMVYKRRGRGDRNYSIPIFPSSLRLSRSSGRLSFGLTSGFSGKSVAETVKAW